MVRESIDSKNLFRKEIENLMENYLVADNIFVMKGKELSEVTEGYFVCTGEFDSLNDVFEAIALGDAVRVIRNAEFQVGHLYNLISECPQDSEFPILHISEQEYVID